MRMQVTEEDLALAAAAGDAPAFEALIERVYDRLFALCFRLTGSRAEAEDLTQDICTALPRKLPGYRGEARFGTWLYRIAVNAAIDRRRRAARHHAAARGWGDWARAQATARQEAAEAEAWLNQAMAALSPALRDTLALLIEGLSHAEIAAILEVSEGTVSWRVSDAKKRLRALHDAAPDERSDPR
jgi:RNA polymerase sigma-70 factor (ECF subfamily)